MCYASKIFVKTFFFGLMKESDHEEEDWDEEDDDQSDKGEAMEDSDNEKVSTTIFSPQC